MLHNALHVCLGGLLQIDELYFVQEENELHERLVELQRKERFLMTRDQMKQQEQGAQVHIAYCMYKYLDACIINIGVCTLCIYNPGVLMLCVHVYIHVCTFVPNVPQFSPLLDTPLIYMYM